MVINIIVGLLTVLLVLNCIVLILLVLMQLPKKEAGLGTSFGAGATDALFGANTGNVLTVATKYSAAIFLIVSLSLAIINSRRAAPNAGIEAGLNRPDPTPPAAVAPAIPAPVTPVKDEDAAAPAPAEGDAAAATPTVESVVTEAVEAAKTEGAAAATEAESLLEKAVKVATNEVEKATSIKVEVPLPGGN